MADLINPTVIGTSSGTDPALAALIASGGFGGGWGGGRGGWNNNGDESAQITQGFANINSHLNTQASHQSTSALMNHIGSDTHHIMARLAQIQAEIPSTALQTQATIHNTQGVLTNHIFQDTLANANQHSQLLQSLAASTADINNTTRLAKDAIETVGASVNLGIAGLGTQLAQQTFALAQVTQNDGATTRALIQSIQDANLQRQLTTAQNEIIELRGDRNVRDRSRETEVSITQTVNQNQAQAQQQQQQQAQFGLLSNILAQLSGITQIAHATNSNVIAGNTGAVVTGPQTANPTNVNA